MRPRGVTVVVQIDGDLSSHQYRVPLWAFEAGKWGAVVVALLVVLFFAFSGPLTRAAARVPGLEHEVARLRHENDRVQELAAALNRAEANYQELRQLLGVRSPPENRGAAGAAGAGPAAADSVLMRAAPVRARLPAVAVTSPASAPALHPTQPVSTPPSSAGTTATRMPAPAAGQPAPNPAPASAAPAAPATALQWPLDIPGFVTRGQVRPGDPAESHPGIDIAVPVGSTVRAAGTGIVETAASDSDYGMFVLLRHPGGYETMYGHASRLLVHDGDSVQAGQVIALSGNSGRSTAPHLHFEIRRDGKSLDPLTMVKEEK
jgi:murein DD-endopeptidase MepM/ murein hydrolase activator NlpD